MRTFRSPDLSVLRSEVAARLGLPDLPDDAAFEQECREFLADLRWPGGVECPRCSETSRLLWLESRSKWHCYSCRYQFSVTAGTLFHSSHLPVWKWFVAVHLMLAAPNGLSANELRRAIGGSYKTAWFAAHRIRAAMRGQGAELLRSLVEAEQRGERRRPRPRQRAGRRPRPQARRPPPPAQREVPPGVPRRAALALGQPLEPARVPGHPQRPAGRRRHLV